MPFVPLEHPSIGLGLLKAALSARGLEARVCYANLLFAERLGVTTSVLLKSLRNEFLVGEWIFAEAAFPEHRTDPAGFFRLFPWALYESAFGPRQQLQATLLETRRQATLFVNELADEIIARKPRIVGASSVFSQNCASLALLKRIRERAPEIVTMMGGANCEAEMGRQLVESFPFLDYVVSGEADLLIADLCSEPEELPVGVLTKERGGVGRARVDDLDKLPVPDYDDFFETLRGLTLKLRPGLLLESSRGCWWGQVHHCTFCGLNGHGMAYRSRSGERVLQDYAELSGRYGVKDFEVVDNILDMKHFNTVLPKLEGRDYNIFYETKANLKREQVEPLARAGVRWIQPGLESLSGEALKLMDKGTTPVLNIALLKWAREFGIRVAWNILCGFPGEEEAWYAEMASLVPALTHLEPPQGLFPIRFDRYSPYHVRPGDYGLDLAPSAGYRYIYPLEGEALANIAYYFQDSNRSPGFLERPGYLALAEQLLQWGRAFLAKPILAMTPMEDSLAILDTRPAARQRHYRLTGAERAILEACETPTTRKPGWEGSLDWLLEHLLVLEVDGKLLSLPVAGDLPRLPEPSSFPGGWLG